MLLYKIIVCLLEARGASDKDIQAILVYDVPSPIHLVFRRLVADVKLTIASSSDALGYVLLIRILDDRNGG